MADIRLNEKVEAMGVESRSISSLLAAMGKTAFQGRNLAEAAHVWEEMLSQDDLTIILGLSGSLSTAGQWRMVNWLIENRFVDVIVSTGANVSEDIVEAMGHSYWRGDPTADNAELLRRDLNRYYDVYGRETDYRRMEDLLAEFMLTLNVEATYSSMELLHQLGKWLADQNVPSIACVAAQHGVPVFSPALCDSAFGESLLMAVNEGHKITIDQTKEFSQFVSIGEKSKSIGVIYLGGGVPKDFSQLLAISLSPKMMDQKVPGRQGFLRGSLREYYYPHRYAIQITSDSPQWGGLSGCTLEEAISWGKISGEGRRVTCYCDTTIALPIIVHALQEKVKVRKDIPNLSWLFGEVA
jgi:deoxyhypusine synthase